MLCNYHNMNFIERKMKIVESILKDELKERILAGFADHATQETGSEGVIQEQIAFEARNEEEFMGALVVQIFWGQLHIKNLIVAKEYRGRGIGKILMQQAVEFGKKQNCKFAYVETMNFQAPEFYQKLGFKIDFVRHGYDKDTSFYYLSRDL